LKHLLSILFFILCYVVVSQDIERQKAGWIYLLANNISWPEDPDTYVLKVITSDRQLASAIKEMTTKRQINSKPIDVSFSSYVTTPKGMHVLYVTEQFKGALQDIVERTSGEPVLIITEKSTDQQYIMVNLVESSEGMSFQYNRANIINQGLQISPDFDYLGGDQINVATLYQQAKDSVKKLEQRSRSVQDEIDSLNMLTAVAVKLGSTLLTQVGETKEELGRQNASLDKMRYLLSIKELELASITTEISIRRDSVRWGKQLLAEQEYEIAQRDREILGKEGELRSLVLIINNQLEILIFLIVFVLLFIIALLLAYKAYKSRRRDAKKLNEQKEELDELLEKLRSTQTQLIHAEKLVAVGELSDSIAHEVNNASNYILSGIHIIKNKFNESKSVMAEVEALDESDSDLKVKMKVRDMVQTKQEIDFDTYEIVFDKMMSSILVGAERIVDALKNLEPDTKYGGFGTFESSPLEKPTDIDPPLDPPFLDNSKKKVEF